MKRSVHDIRVLVGAFAVCTTAALACPRAGHALTTCTDLCGSGSGACTVSTLKTVAPDSVVDCSGRDITITGTGTISVTDGFFTLKADDLTVQDNGGDIEAVENVPGTAVGFDVQLTGTLQMFGWLHANNPSGGGSISVRAAGALTIYEAGPNGIEAFGTSQSTPGGTVTLSSGGSVIINDPVVVDSGSIGVATGGVITVTAAGNISTSLHGELRANGHNDEGGTLTLTAGGNISTATALKAEGRDNDGNGGAIILTAGGSISNSQLLSARGGANAGGGNSYGGSVQMNAGCGGIQINGPIDATGGELGAGLDGGALIVDSLGNVSVASNVTISTNSRANGGDGGDVVIGSRGAITLNNNVLIDSRGHSTGSGAKVALSGCRADIKPGVIIDVTGGNAGDIVLNAASFPYVPPAANQPLIIDETASLRATGTTNGQIMLGPVAVTRGTCSNSGTTTCKVDVDCTIGCQAGECLNANPDTDGKLTQFSPAPDSFSEVGLASCPSSCP